MYSEWPNYDDKIIKEVSSIIKSGKLNIWKGNKNKKFEKAYAKFIGTKYSLSLSNGSVALEIALKALGINKNEEVIVTSKSYFISAACVLNIGAIPKFVDVDYKTQNISIDDIKRSITKKTKAIICVHLGGMPCDIDEIIKIKKKYNLKIIEDCAQAHGARYKNKFVGNFGDISCWSFCNDKIINSGEGGIICTNNKLLYNKAWTLREGGRSQKAIKKQKNKIGFKYIHDNLGTNSRMTEIQAVICHNQLKNLNNNVKIRNRNATMLKNVLQSFPFIEIYKYNKKYYNSYYRLYIKFIREKCENTKITRDLLLKKLIDKNIPCEEGSCSEIYNEKPFKFLKISSKKNALLLSKQSIAFQVHSNLKTSEIIDISKKIKKILQKI